MTWWLKWYEVPATYADIDDLVKDTGFKPATQIEDGIKNFVIWYKEHYNEEPCSKLQGIKKQIITLLAVIPGLKPLLLACRESFFGKILDKPE